MKPAPFDYFAPTTVDEARDLLAQYGDDACILAGGQSLAPVMAFRLSLLSVEIDVNRLREFNNNHDDAHGLAIEAITRHRAVERSP
jgi:aerobic carbon-monoxide dehydrogenase medium subunit